MKDKANQLNPIEVTTLKSAFDILTFPKDFDLVYEEHVPSAGIALIEGKIELIKNSKVKGVIESPHLIGIKQILQELPLNFGCRVKANSKLIFLGKTQILTYVTDRKSQFFGLFLPYR